MKKSETNFSEWDREWSLDLWNKLEKHIYIIPNFSDFVGLYKKITLFEAHINLVQALPELLTAGFSQSASFSLKCLQRNKNW